MEVSFAWPWSRQKSRWERVREAAPSPVDVRRLLEWERLRPGSFDSGGLRQRLAHARPDLSLPETPGFLQDRLPFLRPAPSPTERFFNGSVPLWTAVAAALGGVMLGYTLTLLFSRGGAKIEPKQLEAAADKIKQEWPDVDDYDIREARGNIKRLSGLIGERTGESPRSVRERLVSMTAGAVSVNGDSHNH